MTYDWWAPYLFLNPIHSQFFWDNFPDNYFSIIFNYLFEIDSDILDTVEAFKQKHFSKYNIGIQIRYPTLTKSQQKDHKGFPVPPINLFIQTANVNF